MRAKFSILSLALSAMCLAAGLGCVSTRDAKLKTDDNRPVLKTAAPVTADQLTSENANHLAEVLWDEMDSGEMANSPAAATKKTKK